MVSAVVNTVRNVVGNIISLFLFFSPVPTFVRIVKKGSGKQYSPAPYLATLISCIVWVLYGLPMVHPNSILVITINGTGTAIELIYIILFVFYLKKKKRLNVMFVVIVELIFIAIVTLLVLTLLHTTKQRSTTVGIICILFNFMMYTSPLSFMKLVISTKSVEYMPFFLSLASLANGISWTTYAFFPCHKFISIPNGLGTFFGLAQLMLYGFHYNSTKRSILLQRRWAAQLVVLLRSMGHDETNNLHRPIIGSSENRHPSRILSNYYGFVCFSNL